VAPSRVARSGRVLAVVAVLCVLSVLAAVAFSHIKGGTVTNRQQPPLAGPAAPGLPAAPGVTGSCAGQPLSAPRELRGMWLTTVLNIDFPSKPGLDEATVKAEYLGWLDVAQKRNYNAIFVHVRPAGDAFWPSAYAPWSEYLTGKRDGVSPGWDPLAFMVTQAHARDLEFHAWFNPYRGSEPAPNGAGGDMAQLAPNHPLRAHPDWAITYPIGKPDSRIYFDPGIPAARKFVEDSMLEAVQKYDIDGVHFDDFFYPYPSSGQQFGDDASFAQYGKGFASREDWRRDNVDKMVQEMSQRIKALKPWVKFGISPFGIWRNASTDPAGSQTQGLQSYDAIYADTRLWVTKGWLDYVVPQLYWTIGFAKADYAKILPWWSTLVTGTKVQLYIGLADYRVGEAGDWSNPGVLDQEMTLNAKYAVSGDVHFTANSVRDDKLGAVSRYTQNHAAAPALLPLMSQLPSHPPAAPTGAAAQRAAAGATTVTWQPGPGAEATSFAVYRVDRAAPTGGTGTRPNLVATVRYAGPGKQTWVDHGSASGQSYQYCVAALDRSWNEGPASAPSPAG
jgi:uncharacterized lipoprotein YddW (UPF0748 family)